MPLLLVLSACAPGTAAVTKSNTTPTGTVAPPVTTTPTDTTGTTPTTLTTSTSTTTTTPTTVPFTATFTAELYGDAVALRSNVPWDAAACTALGLPDAALCDDADVDGLTDAWEDGLLDRLRPAVELHEDEPWVGDGNAELAMIGRVYPEFDTGLIHVHVAIALQEQYDRCGFGGHDGDSERVIFGVQPLPADGPGDAAFVLAYTGAHENDFLRNGAEFYEGAALTDLVFEVNPADGQPRWKVFAGLENHAIYANIAACEAPSPVPIDCAADSCGIGGANPAQHVRLPPAVNAGEADAPRVGDLSLLGFPNEEAWANQSFCGGLGRSIFCDASVRSLLVDNPL